MIGVGFIGSYAAGCAVEIAVNESFGIVKTQESCAGFSAMRCIISAGGVVEGASLAPATLTSIVMIGTIAFNYTSTAVNDQCQQARVAAIYTSMRGIR